MFLVCISYSDCLLYLGPVSDRTCALHYFSGGVGETSRDCKHSKYNSLNMSTEYRTATEEFSSIIERLQPVVLSNFVLWLDLKVAEFKVYGQMTFSKWLIEILYETDN